MSTIMELTNPNYNFNIHPVIEYINNVEELYNNFLREKKLGNVLINSHPDYDNLKIIHYTQETKFNNNWNYFTFIARGMIIDTNNWEIIAIPFPTFFNYGEITTDLPKNKCFTALTKEDGSCAIIFNYDKKWHCSTRRSFCSEQAIWGTNFIRNNWDIPEYFNNITLLGEIIYPENRIVIDYGNDEKIVLLGGYNKTTCEDVSNDIEPLGEYLNSPVVKAEKVFNNIEEVLNDAESLDANHEGYVIIYENGYRVKIKGDEYKKIHRAIFNMSPLSIWEFMLHNDENDINTIIKNVDNQFAVDRIKKIHKNLLDRYNYLYSYYKNKVDNLPDVSKKELGIMSSTAKDKFVFTVKFNMIDTNETYDEIMDKNLSLRKLLFKMFRPDNNVLKGNKNE